MGRLKILSAILAFSILPVIIVWLPFILRLEKFWEIPLGKDGLATIVANYDGPLYIIIAKTLYNTDAIRSAYPISLPVEYYAAHFPLFPLLIRLFSFIGNYPYSMLLTTIMSSVFAFYFFYKLIEKEVKKEDILWMLLVFSVLPARWLVVRSVGSPEPLFVGSIIASLYFFKNKKYFLSSIFGVFAQLTKSPGILLFASYLIFLGFDAIKTAAESHKSQFPKLIPKAPILLIPVSLFCVFALYSKTFGNFFAYFNSGDNIHLFFPPFQIFNYSQPWVNTFWLEEVILVYIFSVAGIIKLFEKKEYEYGIFAATFFLSIIFVSHRDIIRYSLPLAPLILFGFSETLTKRQFKVLMAVIIIPIYLFSLAFISQNVMPIPDWRPFL